MGLDQLTYLDTCKEEKVSQVKVVATWSPSHFGWRIFKVHSLSRRVSA